MSINPPILRALRTYLASVWFTPFTREEMAHVKELIGKYNGIITRDNLKFGDKGHRLEVVTIGGMNAANRKFAWGYDQILNWMLESYGKSIGASEQEQRGILRPVRFVDCKDLGRGPLESFPAYEHQGFVYANRK